MAYPFTPEEITQILDEYFSTILRRQYIGARYVPIFGRKDEESIDWDNTGTYEPLTIVLYQGNSYTSRQYVPVGVEITNTEYWALTGNYNSQVEQYRRETAAVKEQADAIEALIPSEEFSSESTVKDYIDSAVTSIEAEIADIDAIIPSESFDSTNTVKAYIDSADTILQGNIDSVAALLPSTEFTDINTVYNAIVEVDKDKNKSYVGNYGAVEGATDNDWPTIVAAIAAISDTIYFGSGTWDVGSGISLPNTIVNVCGNNATLVCSESVDYMLQANGPRMSIIGINFDGGGIAKTLLNVTTANTRCVMNCHFYNIGNYIDGQDETQYNIGIEMTATPNAIGLVAVGCTFGLLGDISGGVGIKTHTDNQIVGCKFFKMDYAILARGCNIGNCYFWTNSTCNGVVLASEHYLTTRGEYPFDVIFTNCEFDCIQRLVINPRNTNVNNCHFYWNDRDLSSDADVVLFSYAASFASAEGIRFNYNIFKVQLISYDIYMFGIEGDNTVAAMRIADYKSKGNIITDIYNTGTLNKYHLLIGISYSTAFRAGSRPNCFTILEWINYAGLTGSREFIINSQYNKAQFVSESATTHELIVYAQPRSGVNNSLKAYKDTDGKFYIPWHPMSCIEITILQAPPFMFTYRDGIELPDAPDLESMTLLTTYTYTPTSS